MSLEERVKKHQALRIRRLFMSVASYWMGATVVALGAALQIIEWRYVDQFILIFMAINAVLYLFFRSGLNLRFADPSLTALQITLAPLPCLYVMYYIQSTLGRAALLIIMLMSLIYGILELSIWRFLAVTSIYFIGYLGLFLLLAVKNPHLIHVPGEWMVLAAMALFMVQMTWIGGYISQLRNKLSYTNRRIREMAVRDELTGCYNRHHLMEVLEAECARANRGGVYSICLIDIDHFKQVNDRYGHGVGDNVLRRCADHMRDGIREIDTLGRYGGEEFLLIMPQTRMRELYAVADRLRTAIEKLEFGAPHERFSVSVSIGVAEGSGDSTQPDALLQRADDALYRAKRDGRNQVCAAAAAGAAMIAPGQRHFRDDALAPDTDKAAP